MEPSQTLSLVKCWTSQEARLPMAPTSTSGRSTAGGIRSGPSKRTARSSTRSLARYWMSMRPAQPMEPTFSFGQSIAEPTSSGSWSPSLRIFRRRRRLCRNPSALDNSFASMAIFGTEMYVIILLKDNSKFLKNSVFLLIKK